MDANLPASYDVWRTSGPDEYDSDAPAFDEETDVDPEPYNPDWDTFGDVLIGFACPNPECGNREADMLTLPDWGDGDDVHCDLCGLWYKVA